jgi:RNA polymerase sigma-70 factor, ECF subfamily
MDESLESDEALMLRVLRRDYGAYEALYRRRSAAVYRQVFLWVRMNRDDADDIAQQTWMSIAKAKQYEPNAKFMTWALTIARNKVLNWQDSSRMKNEVVLEGRGTMDEEAEDPLDKVASGSPGPESALSQKQCSAVLLKCLRQLTHDQRDALVSKESNDLSAVEVGVLLQKNANTVKNLVAKAYKNLRACIEGTLGSSVDAIVAGFS